MTRRNRERKRLLWTNGDIALLPEEVQKYIVDCANNGTMVPTTHRDIPFECKQTDIMTNFIMKRFDLKSNFLNHVRGYLRRARKGLYGRIRPPSTTTCATAAKR